MTQAASRVVRAPIAPGAHIELRDAIWRVVQVDLTSSGKSAWRCVGVSEVVRDREAVFLEELEDVVEVLDPRATKLVRDGSPQHRAGLLYLEALLRDVPPPDDAIYVGHQAAMDVLEFQLDPAWRALQRPRQRILIADAVGLGKTLEAGILLSELIRRGRARRILVATTKAMLTQFQKEMWARFSIPLVRLDSDGLAKIRRDLPSHHNPFYALDKTIISIDTLKQNSWFRTHVEQAYWDVIVIDEAHNVATRARRDGGASRSLRAQIAGLLSQNCDSLILLSATPHDGKAASFASLMNMLDPTAIADPDHYGPDDIRGLYVRRFKHHVQDQLAKRIPERTIQAFPVPATAEEEAAFERLAGLRPSTADQRVGSTLFRITLEKALFSSPAACLATIDERVGRIRERPDAAAEVTELGALRAAVDAIPAERFGKYRELLRVLREELKWTGKKKDDRLVVFTERRQTLRFLADHLPADLGLKEGQWEVLHGGSDLDQQRIVEDFGKERAKVRLLLATDVASEGLNLHYLCHRLVHFDVPWSLMVFQQRNGRIDRYGQTAAPEIVYLHTTSANPRIRGDQRILEVLIAKDEQARKNIGDPSAFMNRYDVEGEEEVTAGAMERGLTPEAFDRELEAELDDPFAKLFEEVATESSGTAARTGTLPTLFGSDLDYLAAALDRLAETDGLVSTVRREEQLVELPWTRDLQRRFRHLPAEVTREDGVALLTADADRMQRALADARKEESAWPQHQYLWPNHPVLGWVGDRMRSQFGRHAAPVLVTPGLRADQVAVVVSGLLPNRRGQALVHRWYTARYDGDRFTGVEPFEDTADALALGSGPMPNANVDLDLTGLQRRLPAAVDAVSARIAVDRDAFRARLHRQLDEQLDRLKTLEGAQLAFVEKRYADRPQQREQGIRRVRAVFKDHDRWVRDAMTVADAPFLQVLTLIVGSRA